MNTDHCGRYEKCPVPYCHYGMLSHDHMCGKCKGSGKACPGGEPVGSDGLEFITVEESKLMTAAERSDFVWFCPACHKPVKDQN